VEAAKAVAAARKVRAAPFELPVDSAKYVRGNEMVWVGPKEMPEGLKALVESLHFVLYKAEFILERRPFAAHVTLLRRAPRPKAIGALPPVAWPVREFALVNSVNGAYRDVERFPLEAQKSTR
jgi:2'-5' RNA ligase